METAAGKIFIRSRGIRTAKIVKTCVNCLSKQLSPIGFKEKAFLELTVFWSSERKKEKE